MPQNLLKLGSIGYGNMASAILKAASGAFAPDTVCVADTNSDCLSAARDLGFATAGAVETVQRSDIILLAVKPQQFGEMLAQIAPHTAGRCVVSIAAGISRAHIAANLSPGTYVVRVMPNTPIMLGQGATVMADCPDVPEHFRAAAMSLFNSAGITVVLPEDKINEATGLNGSSPAYFFLMAEAMVKAGEQQGIASADALTLAAKAMQGAAEMLLKSGKAPEELRKMVCSPGGTTLAALEEMEQNGFSRSIIAGMLACTKRAYELGA